MIAADGVVQVNGQTLEARWIEGDLQKPVIVMLHEGLGCVSLWRNFTRRLRQV
jgi:hypothetical protein